MSKPFKTIVPEPFKAIYDQWQFAPAVLAGGVIHISGQVGANPADMSVPDELETQLANIFGAIELILAQAGAKPSDVFSLTSYHVGDLHAQMPVFIEAKSRFFGAPHPAWTAVGVSELALPGLMVEVSAMAVAP